MKKHALPPGEFAVRTFRANRTQGRRAVGGHLVVTTSHVRFFPHVIDRATGGKAWAAPVADITGTGVADRSADGGPYTGGMRKRLRLDVADGSEQLFVVNRAPAAAAAIAGDLGLPASDRP